MAEENEQDSSPSTFFLELIVTGFLAVVFIFLIVKFLFF
jgi:hypothetical protein